MYKDDDDDDGIEIKAAESFVRISKNLPKIYNKELIKVDWFHIFVEVFAYFCTII